MSVRPMEDVNLAQQPLFNTAAVITSLYDFCLCVE